jgi:hypothetical protein
MLQSALTITISLHFLSLQNNLTIKEALATILTKKIICFGNW